MNHSQDRRTRVVVREVNKIKDVIPLAHMIYKNFEYLAADPTLGHNMQEITRMLTSADFKGIMVYDANNHLVAYIVGEFKDLPDGRSTYYISYLYVSPTMRGRKIASRLMNMVEQKCQSDWDVRNVTLTCDTTKPIFDFYKKRGYIFDPIMRTFRNNDVLTLKLM